MPHPDSKHTPESDPNLPRHGEPVDPHARAMRAVRDKLSERIDARSEDIPLELPLESEKRGDPTRGEVNTITDKTTGAEALRLVADDRALGLLANAYAKETIAALTVHDSTTFGEDTIRDAWYAGAEWLALGRALPYQIDMDNAILRARKLAAICEEQARTIRELRTQLSAGRAATSVPARTIGQGQTPKTFYPEHHVQVRGGTRIDAFAAELANYCQRNYCGASFVFSGVACFALPGWSPEAIVAAWQSAFREVRGPVELLDDHYTHTARDPNDKE